MTMTATVLRVDQRGLLVRNMADGGEVYVHTSNARSFRPGDVIRITYSGAMTFSIPPQITATSIIRIPQPAPQPSPSPRPPSQAEIRRAQVLQVSRGTLTVRNLGNNQTLIVSYPQAHHFCRGQRVNIRYSTITLTNPPRVTATEITPLC